MEEGPEVVAWWWCVERERECGVEEEVLVLVVSVEDLERFRDRGWSMLLSGGAESVFRSSISLDVDGDDDVVVDDAIARIAA